MFYIVGFFCTFVIYYSRVGPKVGSAPGSWDVDVVLDLGTAFHPSNGTLQPVGFSYIYLYIPYGHYFNIKHIFF